MTRWTSASTSVSESGRKKGSRNELGEDFIQALAEDFERHGAAVIERVRERPADYLKLIAGVLPKDLNLNLPRYDDLTDEQLISRLSMLTMQAAPLFGRLIDHDPAKDGQTRSEHGFR